MFTQSFLQGGRQTDFDNSQNKNRNIQYENNSDRQRRTDSWPVSTYLNTTFSK